MWVRPRMHGTTSRCASRDDCSPTKPAVSGGRLTPRRTAPLDEPEQSGEGAADGEPRLNHRPDVAGGLLEPECAELLRTFFKSRR